MIIRRHCDICEAVTTHRVEKAQVEGSRTTRSAKTREIHRCLGCDKQTPRYDLRPRSWAGV